MLFQATITIPAATRIDSAQQTRVPLVKGIITRITTEYPYGCGELAGVRILRGINQIWPVSEGEYVSWENGIVSTPEAYTLDDAPLELIVDTINYDALNAHTVTVRIEIEPALVRQPPSLLQTLRDLI